MESTAGVSNSPIMEVLNRNNYKKWRLLVKTYLLAEDLWEVVEAVREPAANPEDEEAEYKDWKRKDAKALYAIQNSCGPEMFHFICETETAKRAWEVLEKASKLTGHVENSAESFEPYVTFTKFLSEGEWDKANECLKLKQLDLHSAVRARDGFGDTAIHIAAAKGHVNILKELVLLMNEGDLKMKNARGNTALHVAASNGQLCTVKELVLLIGEETNKDGDTALHTAAHRGKATIVKELVRIMKRRQLTVKNNDGYTALHVAVKMGNVPMLKDLAVLVGEVRGPEGDTALHIAVKTGDAKIVKQLVLLMRRKDLAIKNDEGYTAFHLAVHRGNAPIVKEFIPKQKEHDFDSYIEFTTYVESGDWENAKKCLTKLDDPCDALTIVDPRDEYRDTAIHVAVREGHVDIVKELISLLKVREEKLELKTVEDIVAFGSHISSDMSEEAVMEKAKYMVEQHEKMLSTILDVQNAKGSTPLQLAVLKGNVVVVKELVTLMRKEGFEIKDVDGDTALLAAVGKGYVDIVKELAPLMRKEGLEMKDGNGDTALHYAVGKGYVDIVKELVPLMRQEGLELKTAKGSNALHLAVMYGHMNIVKVVMPLMRKEALEEKDGEQYTALGWALDKCKDEGVMEMAKFMAENNTKVFGIEVPTTSWIPVVWTCSKSKWELCHYLYPLTPLEFLLPEYGNYGAKLVCNCLRAKRFDMALHLLQRCPTLAITRIGTRGFPLMELAGMHSAFLSGIRLGFWQKLIYNRMHIEPATLNVPDICIEISKQTDHQHNQMDLSHSVVIRLYKEFLKGLLTFLGVDRLHKMKWIHTRSNDVLLCIGKMIKKNTLTTAQSGMVKATIFRAVECGHVEFVIHMCQAQQNFVKSTQEWKNIFHFAVECRQNAIYNLIYGLDKEDQRHFGLRYTKYPENMLHLAGNLSPTSRSNRIRGADLQMQRELQWFKEVENIVPLQLHEIKNSDGMTPSELFTKNHEKLKMEAQNSLKGTATSCTVVGALIVTITFAAAFTVPGGNDGTTGIPMFLARKLFKVFIISDTLSLVSSTTSVILFLGILTSRYAEVDFLKSLPTKMMIGLLTLFLSITTMMVAFCSALIIMIDKEYSWAIAPSIVAASIPVASFIWLQFPLLIEIFWSTYGPGIFDRKTKPWIKL